MTDKTNKYKGNRIIPIRLSKDAIEQIEEAIASANARRSDEEYTVSEWIRSCIKEKLDKLRRGRKGSAAKREGARQEEQAGEASAEIAGQVVEASAVELAGVEASAVELAGE